MDDITIVYLTNNELNLKWQKYQIFHLLKAANNSPIISISRKPLSLGFNIIQSSPKSGWNIYMQILRAAYLVKTPYIGIAEDDTLYTPEHYSKYRPAKDAVSYDMSRWSVFSWQREPIFSAIRKYGNFAMIGSTEYIIDTLEEWKQKHPNGYKKPGEIGRRDIEKRLGTTHRNKEEWYCRQPIVNICHPKGLSPTYINNKSKQRAHGELRAYDIPYWGKAKDIIEKFNNESI